MNKELLFLLGNYPSIGGVESITTNLANEFVKMGMGVHIVSFEQTAALEKMNLDNRVKVIVLTKPVLSKTNKETLRKYIYDNKIEIVLNQWCLPFYTTMLLKYAIKDTNCKLIQVHHNNPITNARLKQIESNLEDGCENRLVGFAKWHLINLVSRLSLRYAYSNCEKFVFLSESFLAPFLKYVWICKSSKVAAIPNCFFTESDGVLPIKEKEILYLGRIDFNQKRVRRVIDIWNQLEARYPEWHLTVVGDGPDLGTVKKMVADYRLKRVFFEGFQKADRYFRRAPIMLLVSEYEGFGIVLVEAQSYGCVPVALDSYTALHDIVENHKNGVIIDYPYQLDKFVKEVSKLIEDKETLERCEFNAIKNVEKFKLPCVLNMWLELFNEVCNDKS